MSKTLSLKTANTCCYLTAVISHTARSRLFHSFTHGMRNNYIYVVRSRQSVLPKKGSIWFRLIIELPVLYSIQTFMK